MNDRSPTPFPDRAPVALSLTFDDARDSQLDVAVPMLEAHRLRATFYVLPGPVSRRRSEWQALVENRYEIGNHSVSHPCSASFPFSRTNAPEDYSLRRMEAEIDEASDRIERLVGVRPESFAHPCGQSFVGRGEGRASYVPVVCPPLCRGTGIRERDLERSPSLRLRPPGGVHDRRA